jgi:hypothetical protein
LRRLAGGGWSASTGSVQGLVVGSCEHSDEPSSSGTTQLLLRGGIVVMYS